MGARGGIVVKALRYKPAGRGFDSGWIHWNFSVTYSFWSHYGRGVDSASNRNEYQVYFLGVKGKDKGRLWVLQHCCLESYCTLTRMSSFIHLQRRCIHQETSASEGRNYTWNLASNP